MSPTYQMILMTSLAVSAAAVSVDMTEVPPQGPVITINFMEVIEAQNARIESISGELEQNTQLMIGLQQDNAQVSGLIPLFLVM